MKWVFLCVLALQVPIDAPPPKQDDEHAAHERRREAIEAMNEGVGAFAKHDFAGAEQALKRAIELDPRYSRPHVNLGRLLAEQGRHPEALRELEQSLSLVEAERGRVKAGSETFAALTELRGQIHYDLGRLFVDQAEGEELGHAKRRELLSRAAKAFEQASSERPDNRAHHLRGVALDRLDEAVKADHAFRKCIEIQPMYGPCYADLAALYFEYGEDQLAEAVLDTALAVNDTDAGLWLASAKHHMRLERPKQAIEAAKKAKTIDPDLHEALFILGMAYAELRMRKEATEELHAYLSRQIDEPQTRVRAAQNALLRLEAPPP